MTERDKFCEAYITAALWSSTYGDNGEHNMDDGRHELAPETQALMEREATAFYFAHAETIDLAADRLKTGRSEPAAAAGHDFWLTRNGHGAGFWDGDWPEPMASILDLASKAAGSRDLYVGDDGLIYQD